MHDTIGYVGPGMMGKGIIKNLLANDFPVVIYEHREGLDLASLSRAGARFVGSLAEMAAEGTVVMLTLPSSKEVEVAVLGAGGLLENLGSGSVLIDLGTSYPGSTQVIAEKLKAKGIDMLDSPMAGNPSHATAGELSLMVGGEAAVFVRCLPILRAISKNVFHVGPHGHGNVIKIINNFLGQLSNAGIGVDIKALYDVIRGSGGNSRAFESAVPAIAKRDFDVRFQLKLAYKDIGYVSTLGKDVNMPLPMVNSLLNVLDMAKSSRLGNENTTALIKMWERMNNVEVKNDRF